MKKITAKEIYFLTKHEMESSVGIRRIRAFAREAYRSGKREGFAEEAIGCDIHCQKARSEGFDEGIDMAVQRLRQILSMDDASYPAQQILALKRLKK